MDSLDVARWQFGIITVYHFLFVPITIGMSFLVAGMQTAWVRTGDERWLKLTKLFGKLFLINFAMGVVTGIVQEFQFGMNWSAYSRFVGDIFGAPLAIEALLAFFLESTFLGLWIFGWDRLPKKVHLACIWTAAVGTVLSAYFILAANSWMQNPVGWWFNPRTQRAELANFGEVLTNKVALITFPHTVAGAFLTAGGLVTAVALWHLIRRAGPDSSATDAAGPTSDVDSPTPDVDRRAWRSAVKLGAWTVLAAGLAVTITGDIQGKIMTQVQPMKMAAAEALYETEQPASFSLFTIGTLDGSEEVWAVKVPGLLSWLATGDFSGEVQGINDIQAQYEQLYGPGDYSPNIPVTYWSFRFMIGFGALACLVALWALWAMRKGRSPTSRWLLRAAIVLPLMPLAANSFAWIFTEMGRQPWVVFSTMLTSVGVSPGVSTAEVVTSLTVLTLLYGVLAVVEVGLLLMVIRGGLPDVSAEPETAPEGERPLGFAY